MIAGGRKIQVSTPSARSNNLKKNGRSNCSIQKCKRPRATWKESTLYRCASGAMDEKDIEDLKRLKLERFLLFFNNKRKVCNSHSIYLLITQFSDRVAIREDYYGTCFLIPSKRLHSETVPRFPAFSIKAVKRRADCKSLLIFRQCSTEQPWDEETTKN